jgi:hypothetical protein
MQYRNGKIISTAAAFTLKLGFVPDKIILTNDTVLQATPNLTGVGISTWNKYLPNGYANITTYTAGVPAISTITTNGVTPVSLGADYQNTIYTITGITNAAPGVVTVSNLTPTNSMTLVNGMTVTISGVVGMTGVNTNRFIVAQISGNTFMLYDTFGNPFSTVGLGTYVSGGQLDVISYPPTAPTLDPVTGQVLIPGNPAGLQLDIGYAGVTLGTGVMGSNNDVIFWEAFLMTPTGW